MTPGHRLGHRLALLWGLDEAHDSEERPYLAEHVRCDAVVGEVQHRELVLRAGVLEVDLEEKAVELGLGKLEDA